VITYINPAVAIVLGILVLNEPFTVGVAIGFPLVIIGAVLATSRSADDRRRRVTGREAPETPVPG
jgi:drug/metabolite transporter (DMT)-like permease